jgi:transposase
LDTISFLSAKVAELDGKLEHSLINRGFLPEIELLETILGVSRIAAMTLIVELGGDLTDFRSADAFVSWAGMCPGHNESAGKRKECKTKPGNRYPRRILCEIANAAVKTRCYFRDKYQNLKVRRGYKKSIIAIGHKILRIVYHMLIKCEPYKDRSVDYQEMVTKNNALRWIKDLTKYKIIKLQPIACK